MIKRVRQTLTNERGTAVLLALGFMVFLLALAGFAVDLAYQSTAVGELEKSMEAAALAGAGNLGFNDAVFPQARGAAYQYALANPYHVGQIKLDLNDGNSPSGNVVLGVWDGNAGTFTPSLDGTMVNAVRCQYSSTIPTTFLRVLGITTLPISAQAIAIANPPANPPPDSCIFPIGLSSCPFQTGGAFSSQGCGVPIKFITSNGKAGSTNTAAWVNMSGTGTPNPPSLIQEINNTASGACPASTPSVGSDAGTQGGMDNTVFQTLAQAFITKFNESKASGNTYSIKDSNGDVKYAGPGWQVYVPVLQTDCAANGTTQQIQGTHKIVGWTRFVMTQGFDNTGNNKAPVGEGCLVTNTADTLTWPWCSNPPPELQGGASRSIFGYYECGLIESPPVPIPVPRAALGTRLKLVKTY